MKKGLGAVIAAAAVVIVAAAGIKTSYVASLGENGKAVLKEEEAISTSCLEAHWDDIKAELSENTKELTEVLDASGGDLSAATDEYCTGNGKNFTVHFTGTIEEADTESRTGLLTVVPDDYNGKYTFLVQTGPVFKGNSIRDSLTCISFSDFENQIEWSKVSGNIMAKITEEHFNGIDFDGAVGKKADVTGCFTLGGADELMIAPISLSVG